MFLSLHSLLGPFAFLLYSLVALASAGYVYNAVPETNGRSLPEVQALLAGRSLAGAPGGVQLPARGHGV